MISGMEVKRLEMHTSSFVKYILYEMFKKKKYPELSPDNCVEMAGINSFTTDSPGGKNSWNLPPQSLSDGCGCILEKVRCFSQENHRRREMAYSIMFVKGAICSN